MEEAKVSERKEEEGATAAKPAPAPRQQASTEFAEVDLSLHASLEPEVSVAFDEDDVASHYKRGAPCFEGEGEPIVQLRGEGSLLYFATSGGRLRGWSPGQGTVAHSVDVQRAVKRAAGDAEEAGADADATDAAAAAAAAAVAAAADDQPDAAADDDEEDAEQQVDMRSLPASAFDVSTGRVVVGAADGFAGVWSFTQAAPAAVWHDHSARISAIRWVNGQVYSTGFDGQFLVRNLEQERVVTSYSACACPLSDLVVHDANVVVLSSWDGFVRMLDLRDRQVIHEFAVDGPARCVTLEDDVVYASHGVGGVRSWDMRTRGALVPAYEGNDGVVNALAVSENRLFTGCDDGTVRVFDVVRGACLDALSGHAAGVGSLAVHDGLLYSASDDGTLREYDIAAVEAAIDSRRRRLDEGRRIAQELWLKQREDAKQRKKKKKGGGKKKGGKKK